MNHELKTANHFMQDIISGKKNFEARKNDREFSVGDTLLLKGWYPMLEKYSGEEATVEVMYILKGGMYGIEADHCVMGIKLLFYKN